MVKGKTSGIFFPGQENVRQGKFRKALESDRKVIKILKQL